MRTQVRSILLSVFAAILLGPNAEAQSLRVKITSGLTPFFDETMIHFGTGFPTVDPADIPKFGMGAPGIASVSAYGADLMFNAYGAFSSAIDVPLKVSCGISGMYTLTVYDVQGLFGSSCIALRDQQSLAEVPITQGTTFDFTLNANAPQDPARFVLRFTAPLTVGTSDATCATSMDGAMSVPLEGAAPWLVTVADGQGNVLVQQSTSTTPLSIPSLAAAPHTISVTHTDGCIQTDEVSIGAGAGPVAAFTPSAFQVQVNETVSFSNSSTPGVSSAWDFGDGTSSNAFEPVHAFGQPGLYAVTLSVAAGDCTADTANMVEVVDATAVLERPALEASVFVQENRIMIVWPNVSEPMSAELFSASGRSVSPAQRTLNGTSPMYVSTVGLPAGGYVLRVWTSTAMRSYMVPLSR